MTESGQMLHIALCIVVKYINENMHLFININYKIKDISFKCIAQ